MCVRISVSINDLFDDWQTNSRVFISSIMIKNIHLLFSSEVLVFPSFLSSSSDSFQSRLHFYIVTELLKMTLIFFSCSTAFWPCLFCRFVPRHFALVVHRTSTTYWIYIYTSLCVHVFVCVRVEYWIDPIKWRLHLFYEHFTYSKWFLVLENGS